MSIFAGWCRQAHKQLSKPPVRLSLGQVQEIFAAGFGRRTYAAFRALDLAALDSTAYALLDMSAMQRRAAEFGAQLSDETLREVVRGLRFADPSEGRYLSFSPNQSIFARLAIEGMGRLPLQISIAQELDAQIYGVRHGFGIPLAPLGSAHGNALYRVDSELQFATSQSLIGVPVVFEVAFRRLARGMYGKAELVSVERVGEAYQIEDAEVFDFSHAGMDQ